MAEAKLTKKEIGDLRARLLEERAELGDAADHDRGRGVRRQTQSDLTGDVGLDDESADAGTATFEREKDLSIEQNVRDLMAKIDRALQRIDEGTYGLCSVRQADREGAHQGAALRRPVHQGREGAVAPVARTRGVGRPARRAALLFGTALVVYALDRLTKLWAEDVLVEHPIEVIRGVLTLRFATNSGGAFSLGTSAPWFFATATIVVSALIVVTAFRARPPLQAAALGLDPRRRARQPHRPDGARLGAVRLDGRVVDWVDLHLWPVFNVADSAVVVGAILLGWTSFREAQRHARTGEEPTGRSTPEADG